MAAGFINDALIRDEGDRIKLLVSPLDSTIFRIVSSLVTNTADPSWDNNTPLGCEKEAYVPTPSTLASDPDPAKVETSNVERTILRIRFPASARITNVSVGDIAMCLGLLMLAATPTPSAYPPIPEPARVDTYNVTNTTLRIK